MTTQPVPAPRPPRRVLWTILPIVLVIVLLALLAGIVLNLIDGHSENSKQAASKAAVTAATADMVKLATYSYATIDQDKARAESILVPALKKKYEQIFSSLTETLSQNKVAVTVQVDQAQATKVVSDTEVDVLIFFDQQATSPQSSDPKLTPYAYALTMQKIGGTWLVAAANPAS